GLREWHKILHYLRLCAPVFPIVTLAYLRARAYEDLGLRSYASVFYEMAADLDAANIDTGLKALSTTNSSNAIRRAEKIVASPSSYPPAVLALAAVKILQRD